MRKLQFIITVVAALTFSPVVRAAEGVVVIDQDRVSAGNITPGDAAGYPVTITQPGSYVLSGNLVNNISVSRVVEITTSDVRLDLNGFLIQCNYTNRIGLFFHECIYAAPNTSRIEIRNGSVIMANTPPSVLGATLGTPINVRDSSHSVLEGLKTNGGHFSFVSGVNNRISKVIVSTSPGLNCPSLTIDSINSSGGFASNGIGCNKFNSLGPWPVN